MNEPTIEQRLERLEKDNEGLAVGLQQIVEAMHLLNLQSNILEGHHELMRRMAERLDQHRRFIDAHTQELARIAGKRAVPQCGGMVN